MDWRLKCAAFHLLAASPALYRWLQRATGAGYLTITDTYLRLHQWHVANYRRVHPGRALEFGGGRHFLSPLLLSHAGAQEVLVYDIERLTSAAQINHTIRQLRAKVAGDWPDIDDCGPDLQRKYRIRYCAPGDARETGLSNASIDFVCSTSTLEHIPADDIRAILGECARVARSGAVFSHVIDYKDHYSYSDHSVSPFNFYRYSDRAWRWRNPSNHFQNRLRHSDYECLFAQHPLTTVDVQAWQMDVGVPIDATLQRYSDADLRTHSAYFTLRRA
jgi:SAM-dependent methyltransferase